jgi:hypothetical protein
MPNETQHSQLLEAMRRTAEQLLEHLQLAQHSVDGYGQRYAENEVQAFAIVLQAQASALCTARADQPVYLGG